MLAAVVCVVVPGLVGDPGLAIVGGLSLAVLAWLLRRSAAN